ncbi:MAG: CPBP family intramembrane metalloprotease [Oscillospiraceae bacterium]|nr:CPBP family intramembrane metalloprotease [Oscillospiraceae bacterium]
MEQQINAALPPQPQVIPDAEERRQIRQRYNKAALVILLNSAIFNLLAKGVLYLIAMGYAGEFSLSAVSRGLMLFKENDLLYTLFACLAPIICETAAILTGIKLFKLDFKPMFTRDGFDGKTMLKLLTLCIGLQTASSLIVTFVEAILSRFGLKSPTADLTGTTSAAANVFLYFYACLLGPVLEELLYRGVLLQSMRKYNERFAIFLSAVIFGLMHQNYQQFVLGFLVGIPLAVVVIKSGSLLPSIFAHIIINTSSMLFSCWIQYTSPGFLESALSGSIPDLSALSAGGMVAILCNAVFHYGFMLAALIVGIAVLVKGGNMSRPTPAGKARTWPIFITSAGWWAVFVSYIFLDFVLPFIKL